MNYHVYSQAKAWIPVADLSDQCASLLMEHPGRLISELTTSHGWQLMVQFYQITHLNIHTDVINRYALNRHMEFGSQMWTTKIETDVQHNLISSSKTI
jgi:hypothetical protein